MYTLLIFLFLNQSQFITNWNQRDKKAQKMYLISFHCFEALFIQITTCFPSYISFQKALVQMLSFSLKTSLDRKITPQTSIHKRRHGYWTLLSAWWLWKVWFCSWKLPTCHQPFNCSFMWQKESWEYVCDHITMRRSLHAHVCSRDEEKGFIYTDSLGKSKLVVKLSFMHVCSKLSVMLSY